MNLVDSCGWLEYFANGVNADFFAPAIEQGEELLVSSICLFEVFKRVLQQRGEHDALRATAVMQQGKVIAFDHLLALTAARLSAELKLPMADSIILATARSQGALVWTQDSHFEGLADVRYIKAQ